MAQQKFNRAAGERVLGARQSARLTDRQADVIAAAQAARDIIHNPGKASLIALLAELNRFLKEICENSVEANRIASSARYSHPALNADAFTDHLDEAVAS